MPAAAQRSLMSPGCQRFTLRAWSRTISIMDSIGLVPITVFNNEPVTPSRVTVSVSTSPSRRLAAASGFTLSSWEASARSAASASAASGFAQAARSFRRTQGRSACTR